MATLLAERMFRNCNSSLLRHVVNQSFLLIHIYVSAGLWQVLTNYVALLCVKMTNSEHCSMYGVNDEKLISGIL